MVFTIPPSCADEGSRSVFRNNIADPSAYTIEHNLDGFVIEGRSYMLKSSKNYQAYLRSSKSGSGRLGSSG
jgi:hypothetical protein